MSSNRFSLTEHTVQTGKDSYLHYSRTGITTGPALVFIPGWGGERRLWRHHQQRCAFNYQSLVIDMPGFGQSPLPEGCNTLELMAGLIAQVLDKENIKQAILVGHSLGGALALCCAALYPEKVIQVIGVDSLVFLEVYPKVEAEQLKEIIAPFRTDFEQSVRAISAGYFLPGSKPEVMERVINEMCRSNQEDGIRVLEMCFEWDMDDHLRKYPGPVDVIVADASFPEKDFMPRYGQRINVQTVDNSGHFIMLDQADELQEKIEIFLSKLL